MWFEMERDPEMQKPPSGGLAPSRRSKWGNVHVLYSTLANYGNQKLVPRLLDIELKHGAVGFCPY